MVGMNVSDEYWMDVLMQDPLAADSFSGFLEAQVAQNTAKMREVMICEDYRSAVNLANVAETYEQLLKQFEAYCTERRAKINVLQQEG